MAVRVVGVLALGAMLTVPLAGCTDAQAPTAPAPTAAPTVTATPAPVAPPAPPPVSDGGTPMESDLGEDTSAPVPVWDDASRKEARTLAQDVMTAYARPDAPQEQWWAEFSKHLSGQAAYDYQWVDPASIPARAVTGPATITAEPSVYLAELTVPTDAGTYGVLLSRTDGPSPWQVERITPPESLEQPADGESA
jgi:hypothetical protein